MRVVYVTKSVPLCGPFRFRSWGNGTGEEGSEGDEMSLVAPIGHPSLDVAGGRENALQSSFHGSFEAHPGQSGSDPQKLNAWYGFHGSESF